MNYLQDFIRTHENWEAILTTSPYNLKVSRDGDYTLLKYKQTESDFSIPLVREARGIIFKESDNFRCVCRGFDKFGNYGESYAADIDWESACVQTKIDGSLIKVWYDDGAWRVSTNGTIDAYKAPLAGMKYTTFGVVFDVAFDEEIFDKMVEGYTYLFELVSPHNKIVIPYEKTKLYFLGVRNSATGDEYMPEDSEISDYFEIPERISLAAPSLAAVRDIAEILPWDKEGYVVCDGNFNRIKVKSPAYVAAHYLVTNKATSMERLVDIILNNEVKEFLTYAPEYRDTVYEVLDKMSKFKTRARGVWERYKDLETVKDVALALQRDEVEKKYHGYVFSHYRTGVSFDRWVEDWDGKDWVKVL